jgi:LPS-assembly lipoprotein
MTRIWLALLSLTLAACGFHIRGHENFNFPFQTLYVESAANSPFVNELRRSVRAVGTKLAGNAKEAEAVLHVLSEAREKSILSLSGAGRVREYRLLYRVSFRLNGPGDKEMMPESRIELTRDLSFNEGEVLAKESEEALLYRDMENDASQQILRRLGALKK